MGEERWKNEALAEVVRRQSLSMELRSRHRAQWCSARGWQTELVLIWGQTRETALWRWYKEQRGRELRCKLIASHWEGNWFKKLARKKVSQRGAIEKKLLVTLWKHYSPYPIPHGSRNIPLLCCHQIPTPTFMTSLLLLASLQRGCDFLHFLQQNLL